MARVVGRQMYANTILQMPRNWLLELPPSDTDCEDVRGGRPSTKSLLVAIPGANLNTLQSYGCAIEGHMVCHNATPNPPLGDCTRASRCKRFLTGTERDGVMSASGPTVAPIDLVQCMRAESFYPESPSIVEMIETHISWIFLTDRFAYKLKKPVKFEFVDFSAPELRHWACLEEVRLNRRLSPNVYLGVLPLSLRSDGGVELAGSGTPIDWVVQMRRLPADTALDQILRRGQLVRRDAQPVADHLTSFYASLPSLHLSPADYSSAVNRHVRANGDALLSALPEERGRIRRVHSLQRRYLAIEQEVFDHRVADGWIVDGHGDLRPEHIYIESPPAVIDCIEFSQELRSVDVADELSFLVMECKRLGDGGLGELVLETYRCKCGDPIPPRLLAFYAAYRACVRAKVTVLRAQQQPQSLYEAESPIVHQYLTLADHYTSALGVPTLLLVGGLMGTGKSTLASAIADAFGAEIVSTDEIRRSLLGASPKAATYGEGNYQPAMRASVYEVLIERAKKYLQDGLSVILDATFMSRALRERAYDLATAHKIEVLFAHCQCPKALSISRIQARTQAGGDHSEARPELYEQQAKDFESPSSDEPTVTIDTSEPAPCQMEEVYRHLCHRLFSEALDIRPRVTH